MPLSFHLLPPPYGSVSGPISDDDVSNDLADAGVLLVFRLDSLDADLDAIATTTAKLRRRCPGLPFVLWPALDDEAGALAAAVRARALGIRAAIAGSPPDPAVLRRQLTDTSDLSEHVVRWLGDAGYVDDPDVLNFLKRVFAKARQERASEHRTAYALGMSPRGLRADFAARGLPPPSGFLKLALRLEDGLAIQAAPDLSLAEVAFERGFGNGDREALRATMKRTFGIPSTRIRKLLGAEPLLARWIEETYRSGS
jgi:AraC-like DNA-binding protein